MISRRRLLVSGSAAALVATLPVSAVPAAYPKQPNVPRTDAELLDHALDIAKLYWRWPHVRAQVFDIDSAYVQVVTDDDARRYVHEHAFRFGSSVLWERVFLWLDIAETFVLKLGPDIAVHRCWLNNTQIIWERATANDMMLSADPGDMRHVLWRLEDS